MKKLMSFRDWIIARESSPSTRAKTQAALGLGPVSTSAASLYGHSTPSPGIIEKLKKKFTKQKVKNDIWTIPEEERKPDYTFDGWINSVLDKAKEISDTQKSAGEEGEKLDKEISTRLKEKDKEDKKEPKPEKDEPQKEDEEEVGKDARWMGHKTEREEREKIGVGPDVGRKQS